MGREVRRVPANWEHPKDGNGHYIPLDTHFSLNGSEVQVGIREGWLKDEPPHYGYGLMPDWPTAERTHWQMYETVSEGTPISPVMKTPEELAQWLVDNQVSAFAGTTASFAQWLATIKRGWAPSAVSTQKEGVRSGVVALENLENIEPDVESEE